MMKYTIVYKSLTDSIRKGNRYEFFAKVRYAMFPELQEEF